MDEVFFPQNNARLVRQKKSDITVIVANPPYSVGQDSENDDGKNVSYPTLDTAIRPTYAAKSSAGLKHNLYDSYVRAFRWASDRTGERGIVCFVSNGSFIDSGAFAGFRKSLSAEFTGVYCFNLRGNARTLGELRRQERDNVFGQGSRTPVAVTLLVKNPASTESGTIHYHDIGDYLTQEDKLSGIETFGSIENVPWQIIEPDVSGDWINQRDETFGSFVPIGDKRDSSSRPVFDSYSQGVLSGRDAWDYNFSREELISDITRMVDFYDAQVDRFESWLKNHGTQRTPESVEEFIDRDPTKISWTRALKGDLRKAKRAELHPEYSVKAMYRPFCKQWLYFDRQLNEMVYQIPRIFPTPEHPNLAIHASAGDARRPFSALMTNVIPDYHLHDMGQCLPPYRCEETADLGPFSGEKAGGGYVRRDAITDGTLRDYQQQYGSALSAH